MSVYRVTSEALCSNRVLQLVRPEANSGPEHTHDRLAHAERPHDVRDLLVSKL